MSTIASVRSTLTHIGVLVAHPAAFVIVGAYVVVWYVVERETLDLHGIATIATWVMTLFIQRAAHRDTQAIHAKLDELVYSHQGARNDVSNIDQLEPEEVEAQRGASGPTTERGTF
jgi:low affinity Fe/Cu permease